MDDKKYEIEPESEHPLQRVYRTGRTRPPKDRSSLVAVLLSAGILLVGFVSILGMQNARLTQWARRQTGADTPLTFFWSESTAPSNGAGASAEATGGVSVGAEEVLININQSPASTDNIPQAGGLSLQAIYEKAIPSVVSIRCAKGNSISSGTGVVLTADGYLLTNCHVVEKAESIQALFTDRRELEAMIIGYDVISDLAVLRVQATNLIPAEFGDSHALRVGDAVAAIGDPLGLELRGTMTDGIVSAINRDITTAGHTMTLIQTNAALNAGNSGGPLLNCYGQVIGINTMKIGDYMDINKAEGVGFAIPSTTVKEVVDQLTAQGYVSGRLSLGISGETVTTVYQAYYRLPAGVYVTQVEADGEAAAKGIITGDIILSFNGVRISGIDTLRALLYACSPGDKVKVEIYREGEQFTVELTVGETK